jgi:hypothetical protein
MLPEIRADRGLEAPWLLIPFESDLCEHLQVAVATVDRFDLAAIYHSDDLREQLKLSAGGGERAASVVKVSRGRGSIMQRLPRSVNNPVHTIPAER